MPRSLTAVRVILALRQERCAPNCPGWFVATPDNRGPEVQRCDECVATNNLGDYLTDDDVAQLPEARVALASMLKESA